LHTITLILIKWTLDARGSKLIPDKVKFGYSSLFNNPVKGGTCNISGWDTFYLAVFWSLNKID